MKEQAFIRDMLTEQLQGTPYFVVDVTVSGLRMIPKVVIALDGDSGIGIDTCAEVSRELEKKIEQTDMFPKGYVLEVSSPGVDLPLKLARQYPKHVGRQLRIQLGEGVIKTGKLQECDSESLTLLEEIVGKVNKKKKEHVPIKIPLQEIEKAFVLIAFK